MNVWILSFMIIFMLHNLEEIIAIEKWFQRTYPRVRGKIPKAVQKRLSSYENITSVQFSVVVFVLSIFVSAIILLSVLTKQYGLFFGASLFFAANIFTHPLQSLFLRCYTPGVLTSLLLIIPYYFFFFSHFYNAGMFNFDSIVYAIVVIVFLLFAFFLSHRVGGNWK